MASKTDDALVYKNVPFGNYKINIIDTPGFGDSRGLTHDQFNFEKIKKSVNAQTGINSVVVVQNGREARFTPALNYTYSSLTNLLPKKIAENLIFVFTNCESENDLTFVISSANDCFGF
jgi:hypothetical protein